LVKQETATVQELFETLKQGPCPLILPINQIMLAIEREPVLKGRLLFEIAHAMRAACIAHEAAQAWAEERVKDHHAWLQDSEVVQGAILPDRRTAPSYAQYNTLMLQRPPGNSLRGMHNQHWTKYQKIENTVDDEKESKGCFERPAVPRRLYRGSNRALQGMRGTISLSLLQDSIEFLEFREDSHDSDEVGEKRTIERTDKKQREATDKGSRASGENAKKQRKVVEKRCGLSRDETVKAAPFATRLEGSVRRGHEKVGEKRRCREACDAGGEGAGQGLRGEGGGAGGEKLENKTKKEARHKQSSFEGKGKEEAVETRKRPLSEEDNEAQEQQHEEGVGSSRAVP
jgi:hypothetical protein